MKITNVEAFGLVAPLKEPWKIARVVMSEMNATVVKISDDIHGYEKVTRAVNIPVAAGESEFTRYGFRDLITLGNVAIVQPDVARAGGISECKKIATLASVYNLPYCPHTGASGAVCVAASLHLSAAIPNFLLYEHMYPPNPLREDILKEPLPEVKDGYIEVSDKPGLGIELDEGKIAQYMSR